MRDENVRGVITMNEEYETRFLCNSYKEWKKSGVEQLRLSTVDMTGIPTLKNLQKGVQFALQYKSQGQCVYVHCKAGRSRSATMVAAYLMQVREVLLCYRQPADLAGRAVSPTADCFGGGFVFY